MTLKLITNGEFNGEYIGHHHRCSHLPGRRMFLEKEIISIFKAAGDYPNCEASRRIQDNISDMQAQAAANAVGGKALLLFKSAGRAK